MISNCDLHTILDDALHLHGTPGASAAVLSGDTIAQAAAGVASTVTGLPVTPETRFLIGSVSKLFTTSLVLQLVGEGRCELDRPVATYLDEFRLAERDAAERITVRHLLTHTSGIQGDHFEDTGRGDDAVARYVASLRGVDLIHDVGQRFSYCNSGFVLAGALVETLTGQPYRHALRERLLEPIGMDAALLPEEAILGPVAVGHQPGDGAPTPVTGSWMLPFALAPAGSIIATTPRELLRFARLHLEDGVGPDEARILDGDLARQMRAPHVEVPDPRDATAMGLGWFVHDVGTGASPPPGPVVRHGGGTTGQVSELLLVPGAGVAVAVVTNGPAGKQVARDVCNHVGRELLGHELRPAPPAAGPRVTIDPDRYVGRYERLNSTLAVEADRGRLEVYSVQSADRTDVEELGERHALRPIDARHFVLGSGDVTRLVSFEGCDEDGRPSYLYTGRLARRVRDVPGAPGRRGAPRAARVAAAAG